MVFCDFKLWNFLLSYLFNTVQLDKISTFSRKDRKGDKYRSDGVSMRYRNIDDVARDEQQMLKFQQTISRLSDSDVNARFEQMLVSDIFVITEITANIMFHFFDAVGWVSGRVFNL